MFRLLFLVFVATVVVQAEHDFSGCRHRHLIEKCCVKKYPKMFEGVMNECRKIESEDKCEKDMCVAKKSNLLADDGSVDKAAIINLVETTFGSDQELIDAMTKNCFEKDISKMGPSDMCEITKYKICLVKQMTMNCNEWDKTGDCKDIEEKVKHFVEMEP